MEINETNFPDPDFRGYVSYYIDTNVNDGYLSSEEMDAVVKIDVNNYYGIYNIQKLQGIEYFKNLTYLDCTDNKLESLDLSACTKLEYLYAGGNKLKVWM